jgi:hypothetical protein
MKVALVDENVGLVSVAPQFGLNQISTSVLDTAWLTALIHVPSLHVTALAPSLATQATRRFPAAVAAEKAG